MSSDDSQILSSKIKTSDKLLIGSLASIFGAISTAFWLIHALESNTGTSLVVFLFTLVFGLFWAAYVTGKSSFALRQIEKEISKAKQTYQQTKLPHQKQNQHSPT